MEKRTALKGNLLFWKIAAVFTIVLVVLGLVFGVIASTFSRSYYTAAHQQLFGDIAHHLATFTQPIRDGKPDTAVTHDIIHSTMVANPSVEVYLLDTDGNIIDFVVPDTTVQIRRVDIAVVKKWLTAKERERPMGDNPKLPHEPAIFSAAPVYENSRLSGYVYAVLASQKQREVLATVNNHLYLQLGVYIFFVTLIVAFIVGIATFLLLTNSIRKIANVVKRFKEGDYSARIEGNTKGDLGLLTTTFNGMADVIVSNIDRITATDKFRQELIANVSHDLRTPLSIMQGYVETLMIKKDKLSEKEQERYLTIVHASSQRLSGLVEQLFQYAKLEANLVIPEKERFLINELASDILMSYQLKAAARSIRLDLDATTDLPAIFADIALTERVLQNLLDNAFKFTPDGGHISIILSKEINGVKVQVADTGVGITTEDQQYIFERYKQLDKESSAKKGMGIGLAIVKKILELHHSTIDVVSERGKGTTFKFTMPA
ncbi:HAMP domain-containing histidine kinase [Chitinophaga pendula]|uniref:sensor histidine kinase n=1 Tax=Chitinophaga TaxID=79328 RepID=UPI000BAE81F2|nr:MULTISPECIES: HAMP domain-containing sensor histidine kinase [Chitinophaga]ASZ12131.1 two-component sensor histidine kinase [Chitinophaga sp. MD30]UCJ04830.1 HAMP domain-containing histidine kinase [Chitinophaga pendula]